MPSSYSPPFALTVLAGIFLALGAVCLLFVLGDIVLRRGWKSMMWIMIPVYIINASYMGPVTIFIYLKYGRPTKPGSDTPPSHACHGPKADDSKGENDNDCHTAHDATASAPESPGYTSPPESAPDSKDLEKGSTDDSGGHEDGAGQNTMHCHMDSSRPIWATVMVGVSHCGAGCVLGDLVGEWLVHGTSTTINGAELWPELLVDYAFALLFGIIFQYFSIAPMSGQWGLKTVWRAFKADILSLTSFEIGLFGWMVAYQVGIFEYRLDMATWTYWWMMQVGMIFGFATAMPVNRFLIRQGIKEPCA